MKENELFPKRQLWALLTPLLLDQLLNVLVGMADTVMVSTVGEAAVSAVSLVDTLNLFFFMIFNGLATGGAILCAQLIGTRRKNEAGKVGNQLLLASASIGIVFLVVCFVFRRGMLGVIFGTVEQAVMDNALSYFSCIALSLPFVAMYTGCAALFRAMGDSKTPMKISICMNLVNLVGNAICLFALHMGVLGVAVPTLLSKVIAAVLGCIWISREGQLISLKQLSLCPDGKMIARILQVGIPSSFENSVFQIGKILVLRLISSLGTVAITANAVANSVLTFQSLTEDAVGLAMITVVGQCVGANELVQARTNTKRLMKYTYIMMWMVNFVILLGGGLIVSMYHLSEETGRLAHQLLRFNVLFAVTIWPVAFTLPNALRAAGHVVFTMAVSLFSMWTFRIILSWIFVTYTSLGMLGIYLAFAVDWVFRAIVFCLRFHDKHVFSKMFVEGA